ncbi:hypothetical protein LCGC14_1248110 [marine sediment metagenome]|uniref:Uncharacterized protein n=1 Tax=marine sediment metagenome TaxID=412755 RepID=A0A0F9P7T7_9ZZZZ
MAAPITNIFFPSEEDRGRVVAAATTVAASGGAAAAKTLTIGNEYPPIDLNIPSPVLAILVAQNGATLAANGIHAFAIGGQMSTAPDSAGEFQILTSRTISIWQLPNETCDVVVIYVSKGNGQKT